MTIRAILDSNPHEVVTVAPGDRVADAIALLAEKRIGALPVCEDGQVRGIFSERDVIYGLAEHGGALLDKLVGDVMTAPVVSIEPEQNALVALSMMTRRRIRHLPVVQGDALAGFVSIGDLVKWRIDRIEAEAEQLREYIQTA